MTDREMIEWDSAEQAIRAALAEVVALRDKLVGESVVAWASENRLLMAMTALDNAMDYVAAARARMPQDIPTTETGR